MPEKTRKDKIVVFDWQPGITRLLTNSLQTKGYEVYPANTIEETDVLIKKHQPDLVIIDTHTPTGGWSDIGKEIGLIKRIRNIHPDIFIIALAPDDNDHAIFTLWNTGVDSALTKPINPREISFFVEKILRSRDEDEPIWGDVDPSGRDFHL